MIILGINAYHGDVSAVLLRDGELIAAVEEERFRRVKHWAGFPLESIRTCLGMAGVTAQEVDYFAISRNPQANLWRKALFTMRNRPNISLVRDRLKNSNQVRDLATVLGDELALDRDRVRAQTKWVEHHPAHLASTFFASPFDEASVCAIDGFGDFVSTSWALGRGTSMELLKKVFFPHSLGLVYLAITQYLGFHKYGDEYKVMGFAPYGHPDYTEALQRLIYLKPDGGFELELSYFQHHTGGSQMTWDDGEPTMEPVYTRKLETLLGPAREPDAPLESHHKAIAASLQVVFEEAAFHILRSLQHQTRQTRLCLAGGCAMNSVMNGKIREMTPFEHVYIQPASGDNGTALGAALYVWHQELLKPRHFTMNHAYWGPRFSEADIAEVLKVNQSELDRQGCTIQKLSDENKLCVQTAELIAAGMVVGWFQSSMEWGARALGNRSILADPRRSDMRDIINTKIKFREIFRPFAPTILEEAIDEYFVGAVPDPFMIQVYPIRPEKRESIPAVVHVDGSGRLQTVNQHINPLYWLLLKSFETVTGIPVLLNTSFNENEPIVHKPDEALHCFLRTQMDALVLGSFLIEK